MRSPVRSARYIDALPAGAALTGAEAIPGMVGGAGYQFGAPQLAALVQVIKGADYGFVLTDGNKHFLHPSADTTPRTWTIPSNGSVAFPIGTTLTFVNQNGAGAITIAITTDTMRLAGAGTAGARTLAANGLATALKITATEWIINGAGLT